MRSSGTYMLGDVGPIAAFADCDKLHMPIRSGDGKAVILPISRSALLVGRIPGFTGQFDDEDIDAATVELSRDFFVSEKLSERETRYLARIGSRVEPPLADDAMAQMTRAVFENARSGLLLAREC